MQDTPVHSRRRWLRLTLWLGGGFVVLGVAALAAIYLLLYPTLHGPPAPNYPKPASSAEAYRQDLDYLRNFAKLNRSFTPATRAGFLAQVDTLAQRAGSLDPAGLEMGVSRAVALANDAHTNVRGAGFGLSLNSVPLRLNWFQEGLFVVAADPGLADLVGARIITEEGRSPDAMRQGLHAFMGGPESFRREHAPHFMVSPQALHAASLAAAPDRLEFVFQLADGRQTARTLAARPQPANGAPRADDTAAVQRENHWPRRDLSPIAAPGDVGQWVHVLTGKGPLPLYLSHPNRFFWKAQLPQSGALYVQINAVRNEDGVGPLTDFLAGVVAEVKAKSIRNVIIDLRFNPGGNGEKTVPFTKDLPAALPADGRIFIVTSGNTLSAGIITAARLKYFGGARTAIVGERIGDGETFWAEGRPFVLPNSKLLLKNTAAYHDWAHGCSITQIGYCYLFNYRWGVAAGDLSPTVPAPIAFRDYIAGVDSVMVAIGPRLAGSAGK